MAFLKQLRLLLWKNGLAIIRQPLWSLTLIIWPLIIFIIIAVARNKFPPVVKETCYVSPRNLPSTGVFPFLQTLMCNTDSTCHSKSRLAHPPTSNSSRHKRSTQSENNGPLENLLPKGDLLNSTDSIKIKDDAEKLLRFLRKTAGSSHKVKPKNDSLVRFMDNINTTHLKDQSLKESANLLKRVICLVALPLINTPSPDALPSIVVTFCKTNYTLFEVSLDALNQLLTELMLTDPEDVAAVAGMTILWFDQIQNQTILWETLLGIPQFLSSGSLDKALRSTQVLLTHMRSAMHAIQKTFPETSKTLSMVHPLLDGGINITNYFENWPGKGVYISFGDVVTLNKTISNEILKPFLQGIMIPLDQAIGLMLDKDLVYSYLCQNQSNPTLLSAACMTGTVDMLLSSVNPEKVAKLVLLKWSKEVAPYDVSFVKDLAHSLMGSFPSEGHGGSKTRRAQFTVDTQPENIEEELFLEVGQVVLDLVKVFPDVEMIFQYVLNTGFQSMRFTSQAVHSADAIMDNLLFDAAEIQMIYQMLLTNQSAASGWIGRVMHNAIEALWKLTSPAVTCREVLASFEWLLNTKSIKFDTWITIFCQNDIEREQTLLMDWDELAGMAYQVYYTLLGKTDFNATLPMILSEWRELKNNSLQFEVFLSRLNNELDEGYWMNWMPRNNTNDVTETFLQSFFLFLLNFGESIEKSSLWLDVKEYFQLTHWILNYRPGNNTAPPKCSIDANANIHCETGFNWTDFVETVTQVVMSPNQEAVVNILKGSMAFLQHIYSDFYTDLAKTYLKQEIKGGDALSGYLINLMKNLDDFVKKITHLSDPAINNPAEIYSLVGTLMKSIGLAPLLPVIYSEGPLNVSTVIDVASKLGRLNQHIFTFDETDPTMPELKQLMMKFLTLEGDLTLSLSHIMGYSLLTYSGDLQPKHVVILKEVIELFTNQTSTGIVEALLTALDLLNMVTSSPTANMTDVLLHYLLEIQKFANSLFKLQKSNSFWSATGQFNPGEVKNLSLDLMNFFNLLTPESLKSLTEAGKNVALATVFEKVILLLPTEVQLNATHFLQNVQKLLVKLTQCSNEQKCLAEVSKIFEFLNQIVDLMLTANGNVSMTLRANFDHGMLGNEEIASTVFSLLLLPNEASSMKTVKQILHFMKIVTQTPNITVSNIQKALIESNLTIQDLNHFTALAGAANINELLRDVMEMANVWQCYDTKMQTMTTAQCMVGLINKVSIFLTHLPVLHNNTGIVSLIPLIVNKTVGDILQMNFSAAPNKVLAHSLSNTLSNIKIGLQMNQLNTNEIMNEIQVIEGLIQLLIYTFPYDSLNATQFTDPFSIQVVYLEIIEWYLKRLENITRNSSSAELLQPIFQIVQMQLTLQVAATELIPFIAEKVLFLIDSLQYPINGYGVIQTGQMSLEILQLFLDVLWGNIKLQNAFQGNTLFNTTILDSTEQQVKNYLTFVEEWMKQQNLPLLLTNMFQWGNASMPVSSRITDLQYLLKMVAQYLTDDQLIYISIINNITHSLNEAINVAEQTADLQSQQFLAPILQAAGYGMDVLSLANITLPPDVQPTILEILQATITLTSNQEMSFEQSRNISLFILWKVKSIIPQIIPGVAANYLLYGVKVITTYFENISEGGGPDKWNNLILDEMRTVQSFLPPNSTEQAYVSTIIKITQFILESGQGNMSLWAGFENLSEDNLPEVFGQLFKIVNMFWPLVTRTLGSNPSPLSTEGFLYVVEVLEQILTREATQDTWKHPNITVSNIQKALIESNLTIQDLNHFTALAGAANINELLRDVMEMANVWQCYDTKMQTMTTAQCMVGLINKVSIFLTHLPVLHNNTGIVSLIPLIVNKTVGDILQMNFSAAPNKVLAHSLSNTLSNIKIGLQMNQLNTDEIMNEIQVIEGLIQLLIYTFPYDSLNATQFTDPFSIQVVYLEIIEWYLKRLENITRNSSSAELLQPIFQIVQMQLTLQVAATELIPFIAEKVLFLIDSLQYPNNGYGVIQTGQMSLEILQRFLDVLWGNIKLQNALQGNTLFNTTILDSTEQQVKNYLTFVEEWMKQQNLPSLLTNMFQWGNASMPVSSRITDLQYLLKMVAQYLTDDQLIYISIINNITHSLNEAINVAEQTADLQSQQFLAPILQAAGYGMDVLSLANITLPPDVQPTILEILQATITLTSNQEMSFEQSRNISLFILWKVESIIPQIIPGVAANYLLYGVKVITTYFENISEGGGPDKWNNLILDEMRTVQIFLPPNSTEQAYVSTIIKITHFILESGQGNMSLWAGFENLSEDNLPEVFGQLFKIVNMFWTLVTRTLGSNPSPPSTEGFLYVVEVLEQILTGEATQDTWKTLGQIMESLLWMLKETDIWNEIPPIVHMLENITMSQVKTTQTENELIQVLQVSMLNLFNEIEAAGNGTYLNFSMLVERLLPAIEHTVKAAQQANGKFECHDLLGKWVPVGEAAGLNLTTMAMWCHIHLQPVLEAHTAAQTVYTHLNMNDVGVGTFSVSATADRIVNIAQWLYRVNVNRTKVMEELFSTIFNHITLVSGHPLTLEAQFHLAKQLTDMQLQQSLFVIQMLASKLLAENSILIPYINCVDFALNQLLTHSDPDQVISSEIQEATMLFLSCTNLINCVDFALNQLLTHSDPDQVISSEIQEATMLFLSCTNLTSLDFSGLISQDVSEFNGTFSSNALKEVVSLLIAINLFEDAPMVLQSLKQILHLNETRYILEEMIDMFVWLASTEDTGMHLLKQTLEKLQRILKPLVSVFGHLIMDGEVPNRELFEDFSQNFFAMLGQLVSTGDFLPPMEPNFDLQVSGPSHSEVTSAHVRRRRDTSMMMMTTTNEPMDDLIDLFDIDYPNMWEAISTPPTTAEMLETAHMMFANPDLSFVLKGLIDQGGWNGSEEMAVDAVLGALGDLTVNDTFDSSSLKSLLEVLSLLPDDYPFDVIKNITKAMIWESQEILNLVQKAYTTTAQLFQMSLTDPGLKQQLDHLRSLVCHLEETQSVSLVMSSLSVEPGLLCHTVVPSLQSLIESLLMNTTKLGDVIFTTFIGDPETYQAHSNWTSVLSRSQNFNISSLSSLNISVAAPEIMTVEELLRDRSAFEYDIQRFDALGSITRQQLLEAKLPNNIVEILSWLTKPCNHDSSSDWNMKHKDATLSNIFCSMSAEEQYILSLLMVRHLNFEKFIYRTVLSEETQSLVGTMLQVAEVIIETVDKAFPALGQLQGFLRSVKELNLGGNTNLHTMPKGLRASGRATFVTLSRALCKHGIMALLGVANISPTMETAPSSVNNPKKEEMIERFKIPRDASPFCMDMYLDMVNTTGGAIAWAFLKPMLMGNILFTPDTPITRNIMKKANATLQEFANLQKNSQDWLDSSKYITTSAKILQRTLPMLQNSLSNSFVKSFIEMQTDIDVGRMKETLSNFSNVTLLLEKNKSILNQISTLSTLMVSLSSCIKFDRYRGYNSADQLNHVAQELAKNRDLYASVLFQIPEGINSSSSTLPPKVSYTIRMHMDNVMRTDRVRNPYFIRDPHMLARITMRYNRGFVYLQENLDRAIIDIHTGQRVSEPAVQLQPFPYPCHHRDEYLEAISFVFPLMLMIAWVLFVADFVKKLVHERELRLHEYMKMMGVNTLSHFCAWFLECATYLLVTIVILTLLLKYGGILPNSDGFLIFLYFCDYGLSIIALSFLISSFFDKTQIASLSGSLLYIVCFFPFIVVMAMETRLTFSQKSALSLFSPTGFSYASQYASRYESQGEGIHWSNSYISPIAGDTTSFGWLCWMILIDSILYFLIGGYIRMVFPGKYGIPAPWYFPFKQSFWSRLCCYIKSKSNSKKGLFLTNIMQENQPVFLDDKRKGQRPLSSQGGEDFSMLPVGVVLHGLTKTYGNQVAIENLNLSFYEGHVTSLLGHNGAGKTTTMSLLTGLFGPSSGTIEVYGRDMEADIEDVRKELGVCMQYDVLFDHMTPKEHLLLYGQIKAPHWSRGELHEQVNTILQETDMYAHRHKRVGTLSGGMRRKLSISIAFIGGSRLVVLDEPTTGVDPCSRRSIWDIVIHYKKNRTIIMSTHHLDEAEVLSDRIAFLERGGLKCCGSPFHLKDKLGQGYKLTLTKKMVNLESERIDGAELKVFIQAHVPEARLKESQGGDLVYSLPPFTSANASSYRSLLTALDANLDALQLGGYGIADTTLEEVFLQLTGEHTYGTDGPLSISETISDSASIESFPSDINESNSTFGDNIKLTSPSSVRGMALAWQQLLAIVIKRFHHSRRDWKGLISQILLPVLFVVFAMGLSSIKSDLQHYPKMELSPALYTVGPSYSFFRNQNSSSNPLVNSMLSFPGIDNACMGKSDSWVCSRNTNNWASASNGSKQFRVCKCTQQEQICDHNNFQPPHKAIPSSQIVYNLSGIDTENYLVATANDFIRDRYGGFEFGMPLPADLQLDIKAVPKNRTLSKVWFNPEGHHTMPAYLNSINNFILRSNLPTEKDPRKYAISVSSHPYFGRPDDEDAILQGMLQILVAMCVLTGFSITTSSFAIYEVNEHHTGAKRLQHIAGVGEPFYWIVNFFYDMTLYMISVTLTVAVVAAWQIPAFTDRQNLAAVTLLLVLFGFATFPWMYLLSGVFKDAETAFITYVCINLFISTNTIVSTAVLHFISQISQKNPETVLEIFNGLCNAFLIFPQFNFGHGLLQLARNNIDVQLLSGYGIDAYKDPFSTETLGWVFISSLILGAGFFILRLLLNRFLIRKVSRLIRGKKTVAKVAYEDMDDDVVAEHLRVSSGAAETEVLLVNQLTKVYEKFTTKVHAVKTLSVGIPAGECFGLLGENGAGKTTTFKMLTGDVSPTGGTAQIRDRNGQLVDIMECRNQGINIGYCPQVDALDDLLTGEEHLYFYARIRGISKRQIEGAVNYLLKRLGLNYHRNIITESYSCGTRRKLSTALALIGHPQILLLDEPSSGMDPRTKRHLWKIISEEVKGKCAVVLTSHSMEECEALCSRLAIMVKGQFQCLGSLQHIKNRFGSGFTVKMYLAEGSQDAEAITDFMQRRFPTTYLKDQHSAMVEYHVPFAPGGVADIFTQLESNKSTLRIKHFSVSQTTLDEVFINFAMGKIGMQTIPVDEDDVYEGLDPVKIVPT